MGAKLADMEAYGQMVLANPDFVERHYKQCPHERCDNTTFFSGSAQGYTDYAALA